MAEFPAPREGFGLTITTPVGQPVRPRVTP